MVIVFLQDACNEYVWTNFQPHYLSAYWRMCTTILLSSKLGKYYSILETTNFHFRVTWMFCKNQGLCDQYGVSYDVIFSTLIWFSSFCYEILICDNLKITCPFFQNLVQVLEWANNWSCEYPWHHRLQILTPLLKNNQFS